MSKLNFMSILERFISLIAPHQCLGCGYEGAVICDWCLPDFATALPARCYKCRSQTDNSLVCKKCRPKSRLKHVWVRTSYEGLAKRLIHDFKFERKQAGALPIVRLMTECLPFLSPDTIVTHVPTAPARIRQRGYDHARLLARDLAHSQDLSYASLLHRVGKTRQVGASRAQRLQQLEGAFQITKSEKIRGSVILLVDDIVTTGGTLEAAARSLRQAGAKRVEAVVFAQKE